MCQLGYQVLEFYMEIIDGLFFRICGHANRRIKIEVLQKLRLPITLINLNDAAKICIR